MTRINKILMFLLITLAYSQQSNACTINVIPVNFGFYQPTSTTTTTGAIYITCPIGNPYNILLDSGTASTGYSPRQMLGPPGYTLAYNLYTDISYTSVWGDGTAGTYIKSGSGIGSTEVLPIYGLIPANQNVADGVYNDTIIVTVEF